jgi:hypothetical protein
MKIKDTEYKFNPYRTAGGDYILSFNRKETSNALEKISLKLKSLQEKYPSLNVNWDMGFYSNRAYLHWSRDYDDEEKQKVKEFRKVEKAKWKKTHINDVKREAKKLGII